MKLFFSCIVMIVGLVLLNIKFDFISVAGLVIYVSGIQLIQENRNG